MSGRSSGRGVRTAIGLGAVGGLGYLLYQLIKNLGLGGGGGGRGDELPGPPSPPKDPRPLTAVMTQPTATAPTAPTAFLLHDDGKTYALEELIDRVKSGGRSDLVLKIRGDVRTGSVQSVKDRFQQAGIQVQEETRVSGSIRGRYGVVS
jgi:hypothetical protein